MSADRDARNALIEALAGYMHGKTDRSRLAQALKAVRANDDVVAELVRFLQTADMRTLSQVDWDTFRRVLAFLGTDRLHDQGLWEPASPEQVAAWPFMNAADWIAHEPLLERLGLPPYDPAAAYAVLPWDQPVPRWATVALLVAAVAVSVLVGIVAADVLFKR